MDFSPVIKEYDLILLLAFGSYGTERFTQGSDIDLAYQARHPLSPDEELRLLRDMIFIFHRDRIDLVNLNKASPLLMLEIATKGRVLYEEKDGFLRFKLKASARYADTRKLRRLRQDYLNQELNRDQ